MDNWYKTAKNTTNGLDIISQNTQAAPTAQLQQPLKPSQLKSPQPAPGQLPTPRPPVGKAIGDKYAGLTETIDKMLAQTFDNLNPETLCDQKLGTAVCPSKSDIPRMNMPNFSAERALQFVKEMEQQGVKSQTIQAVSPSEVKNSQTNVVTAKVAGMLNWDKNKIAVENIAKLRPPPDPASMQDKPILVSNDGYILDGHHRWAWAKVYNEFKGQNLQNFGPVIKIGLPIKYLIDRAAQSQLAVRKTDKDDTIKPMDHSSGYKYVVYSQGKRLGYDIDPKSGKPKRDAKGQPKRKMVTNRVHNAYITNDDIYVVGGKRAGTFNPSGDITGITLDA